MSIIWGLQYVFRLYTIYRGSGYKGIAIRNVKCYGQCMRLDMECPKRFRCHPGQSVEISLRDNRLGILQSHPFMVSWMWDEEKVLTLLLQSRAGFTRSLRACNPLKDQIILYGPLGSGLRLHTYDNVIFISKGIGIAAHLLSIRDLLKRYKERKAQARRITLVWFLEDEGNDIQRTQKHI
jgi:NAD(P)H-flavin reductase